MPKKKPKHDSKGKPLWVSCQRNWSLTGINSEIAEKSPSLTILCSYLSHITSTHCHPQKQTLLIPAIPIIIPPSHLPEFNRGFFIT